MKNYTVTVKDLNGNHTALVRTPIKVTDEEFRIKLAMAKKYASADFDENANPEDYDEHFEKMLNIWLEWYLSEGEAMFFDYLEDCCGYEVEYPEEDFYIEL